jgi:hypothetical protein
VGRHKTKQLTKREQRAAWHVSWYDEGGWNVYQGEDVELGRQRLAEKMAGFDKTIHHDHFVKGHRFSEIE